MDPIQPGAVLTRDEPPTDDSAPPFRPWAFTVDRAMLATRAAGDDRIPIAISSETPVRRYDWQRERWYWEVLDHSAGAVNMVRAVRGLPFIPSHRAWSGELHGRVEDIRLDPDKVMRGWVRFSKRPEAEAVRQDMLDDIAVDVSVGYDPGSDYEESTDERGQLIRRYRNWTPYEVSMVSVPADPRVGKGRAHSAPATFPHTGHTSQRNPMDPNTPESAASGAPATVAESRESQVLRMAALAGATAEQTRALVNSDSDLDAVARALHDIAQATFQRNTTPRPAVQLTEAEQTRYSIRAAIQAAISGQRTFEMEVSDEFAKATGRTRTNEQSFFVPLNQRTQLSAGAANKGATLVSSELRPELIDVLRQRSLALQVLGAVFLPGLVGNVPFPRKTASTAAQWVGEAPGSDMALSSLSLDSVTLSPKILQAATTVSRQLLVQSTPAADAIIWDDILEQHGTAIDQTVFWGPGTGNAPTGIGVAAGTNLVVMGTNGATNTLAKVLEALRVVEQANAMTDNVAFVTTPGVKYNMGTTARLANTDSRTLWDLDTNTVMGQRGFSTNNVPSNLTKGTAVGTAHGAIVGDHREVLVGEWGAGAEIIVDPFTLARRNLIAITSIQLADVQLRRPSAFAVYRDLLA